MVLVYQFAVEHAIVPLDGLISRIPDNTVSLAILCFVEAVRYHTHNMLPSLPCHGLCSGNLSMLRACYRAFRALSLGATARFRAARGATRRAARFAARCPETTAW